MRAIEGRAWGGALTVTGHTICPNEGRETHDREMITTYEKPVHEKAGFLVLKGNLFDFAIMKTSVISDDFRKRYLSRPGQENTFEGRAAVFDGSDDYHARINDPALKIDANTILVIRGSGPVGWPGSAEVVNMQPPDALIKQGITVSHHRRRLPVRHGTVRRSSTPRRKCGRRRTACPNRRPDRVDRRGALRHARTGWRDRAAQTARLAARPSPRPFGRKLAPRSGRWIAVLRWSRR
jgi:hypothetical protein